MDVLHAKGRLDDHFEANPLLAPLGRFNLRTEHVDGIDIGRRADLGNHDQVKALGSLLQNVHNIAVHVVGIQPVDPDRQRFPPPVNIANGLNDVFAGPLLVIRGNSILEIKENHIRRGFRRLFKKLRLAAGNRKFAAVEPWRRRLDHQKTHECNSLWVQKQLCCRAMLPPEPVNVNAQRQCRPPPAIHRQSSPGPPDAPRKEPARRSDHRPLKSAIHPSV